MNGPRLLALVVALASVACGAVDVPRERVAGGPVAVGGVTHQPSGAPERSELPDGGTPSPVGVAATPPPSPAPATQAPGITPPASPGACPITSADDLRGVATLAIDGLDATTAADGWSWACAWVHAPDGSGTHQLVTLKVGWQGTLVGYARTPGAVPIPGLADEAFALDNGARIALRSGELVAVVTSDATAPVVEALARVVAAQLPR